ncbi:MAG: hypothetical protein A2Z34_07690 [Planctomycetes bacterium RBG_16_59_8]|nr:MAG: hypothetical protein A2Z34_07690 [Planctomycetes bacterium RBG_16_59_8]
MKRGRMACAGLITLLGGILLSQPPSYGDDKKKHDYNACAKGITLANDEQEINAIAQKSKAHKIFVDFLKNPQTWAAMLKTIDERADFYSDNVQIVVKLVPTGNYGLGRGVLGHGTMILNYENMARAISLSRGSVDPPQKIITHELCHIFHAAKISLPLFLNEGMAEYVAMKEDQLGPYFDSKKEVKNLDESVNIGFDERYARGLIFFKYLDSKYKQASAKKFIVLTCLQEKDYKEGLQEITGKSWEKILKEELEWARQFVNSRGKQ